MGNILPSGHEAEPRSIMHLRAPALQEHLHHLTQALQGRKRTQHQPVGLSWNHGHSPRKTFSVNAEWRLLVIPNYINARPLIRFAALVICLKRQTTNAA